ncbi:MAG: universal stress protein [Ornithinimicrobium sp.]
MRIVVGYIPTPEGRAAFDRAVARAQQESAKLVVVNTTHLGRTSHANYASPEDLENLTTQTAEAGVECEVRQKDTSSDAAQQILAVALDVDAELIVIGMRRRSPVGKVFMGSTAQSVLLGASCDVLAVKAP